jgi:hypothetical protein
MPKIIKWHKASPTSSPLLSRHRLLSLVLGWGKKHGEGEDTFRQVNLAVQHCRTGCTYLIRPPARPTKKWKNKSRHLNPSINALYSTPYRSFIPSPTAAGRNGSNPICQVNRALRPFPSYRQVPQCIECRKSSLEKRPFCHSPISKTSR